MLLQNNTQVIFSLKVKLTFDNCTTKVCNVNVGDYLLLRFRYNGNKMLRACRVVAIQPVILDTQPESYAASLIVDCSTKFRAERLKVPSINILNIRVVDKEFVDSLAPDYEVTEDMVNKDALAAIPEELPEIPGVGIAGIGVARIIR